MGEGILMYGIRNAKRRYTRNLQKFADKVLNTNGSKGSYYVFGITSKAIMRDLYAKGLHIKSSKIVITDRTIRKYKDHPKKKKGAVVSFNRFIMVEKAVRHPKYTYIDTKRNRLVYVSAVKYSKNKVLKVVIEPNQKIGKKFYNQVTSIGVVNKSNMNDSQFLKIK